MSDSSDHPPAASSKQPSLFGLLKPYAQFIAVLILLAILSNGLSLLLPAIVARGIDAYTAGHFLFAVVAAEFSIATLIIFALTYAQNVLQTIVSERVARDMRTELSAKISRGSYAFIQQVSPAKLLTNLTSDIDAVKLFVSQAIVSIISSLCLIVGASILLLLLNWRLALVVLLIVPIIGGTFFFIFRQVRLLFRRGQEVIDWLNKVINESILGSALIRVLNSQNREAEKFLAANTDALGIGMQILRLFASLIPVITFVSNMAILAILLLGGRFIIHGSMSIGTFAAFMSYLALLIFPILLIGFMSNVIARATASYKRIWEVLGTDEMAASGTVESDLRGDIRLQDVTLAFGERLALKDVSFDVHAGSRTAIIGPTGAGKTQLLYLLTGLIPATSGSLTYDGLPLSAYNQTALHRQIGFVFQDSILFNLSLRENIAFSRTVSEEDMQKAIDTAELQDFIGALPQGLKTIVSERATSLSGGQKQRLMLARALAQNPKILLLDDFTARVDPQTERKILASVRRNYPEITLVSVTQKIASVEDYDQIILLMEGEVLAKGRHDELMQSSPEYVQIFDSQRSTNAYELRPE